MHTFRELSLAETPDTMDALRREGKIRWIATSNYASWQIAEMFAISKDRGYRAPVVAQPMYNVLARGIEQEYLPFRDHYGITNAYYNPLAGGLLSGKQSLDQGPILGTRFDGNKMYLKRFWHDAYFRAVESLRGVADDLGVAPATLALRWVTHRPGADCVILGASRFAHLEQNIAGCGAEPLPETAMVACDEAWNALRGPTPAYNR